MEQQSKQPVQEKMESKLPIKRNWKLLVIVVVFAILVSGGTIWFTQYSKPTPSQTISTPKTPSPRQQQIDTSTWQTYRNDEFGFEVRYPAEKFVRKELPKSDYYSIRVLFEDQLNSSKNIFIDVIMPPDSPEPIDHLEIVVELKKSSLVGHATDRIDSERAIEKDGHKGVELEYVIFSGTEEIRFKTILIEQGDYIYKVSSPTEFADQILSTFRFIDQKPTIPKDKQTCESRGGTWGRFGLAQVELCNLPTSDAGKTCTDSSQCESVCITDDHTLFDAEAKGYCYGWTQTLGTCLNYIKNGKAQGTLCLD